MSTHTLDSTTPADARRATITGRMRRVLCAALAAAGLASTALAATPSPAAADSLRTSPLLIVHGFSLTNGINCRDDATMRTWTQGMRNRGWTDVRTVAWYSGDTNCTLGVDGVGNNTNFTSLTTIAKEFAWMVHGQFTVRGVAVAISAHSMGGLVVRRALDGVMNREAGFPPGMLVNDVVTAGSPHIGTPMANLCLSAIPSTICLEAALGSPFFLTLDENPQGRNAVGTTRATEWSLIGSDCDEIVPGFSAVSMGRGNNTRPVVTTRTRTAPDFFAGGCFNSAGVTHSELVTLGSNLDWIDAQLVG